MHSEKYVCPESTPTSSLSDEVGVDTSPIMPDCVFSKNNLQQVANFSCCRDLADEKRWEKDINDWIRSPRSTGGAIDAVESETAAVWVYFDDNNELIGYASLGVQSIRFDDEEEEIPVYTIPFLGICTKFQGIPKHPKTARLARRIFLGLLAEASKCEEFDFIFLYVDPDNPARTRFYPEFGFTEIVEITEDGRQWVIMRRPLR